MMNRARIAAFGLLAAVLASACAKAGAAGSGGSSYAPDDVVLRIDVSGGFVPPPVTLTHLPSFTLYGDGRVVTEGAQIEIYPQPSLPPILVTRVDDEGFRQIIEAARAAGLDGPERSYTTMTISDAPTTTFTLLLNDRRHVVSVYALGVDELSDVITAPDRRARAALLDLQSKLGDLRSWLPAGSVGDDHPFELQRLAMLVGTDPPGDDQSLPQHALTWPLDRSPAQLAGPIEGWPGGCLTVSGQDLATILPLAATANELTPWVSGGERFWLRLRPLLPDEPDCSALF